MQPLSVSTLNNQIKSLLETSFSRVLVEGELSRITYHTSGHIYFSIKDNTSTIKAVMFRGNATKLRFRLEEGLKVIIDAAITLYTPRGEYQLNCFSIEPSGQGALAFAFEQLKSKLQAKGYFDPARKKPLPRFPKKVALITSATGAALQDMLRIAQNRYLLTEFFVYDVLVQGENAAASIAKAVTQADSMGYDAIIVGRGGGSMEDLWAFNEEVVADAIFAASTPVISAVGHEIDTVISDFVADVRAATPSNAMELLLPDKTELLLYIDNLIDHATNQLHHKIHQKEQTLRYLLEAYEQHSIEHKLQSYQEQINFLQERFKQTFQNKLTTLEQKLSLLHASFPPAINQRLEEKKILVESMLQRFYANNPKEKTNKGFAQVIMNKKPINIKNLNKDATFELQSYDTIVTAKVLEKKELK